jgi:hypothetical protein
MVEAERPPVALLFRFFAVPYPSVSVDALFPFHAFEM